MFLRDDEVGGRVSPHLEAGQRVLDYGSGTGLISRWLARRVGIEPVQADTIEYSNRRRDLPFLTMPDPYHLDMEDGAFDVVLLLFALHHNTYDAQGKVLAEAARLASNRVIVLEDTPLSRVDRAFNVAWDKVLNLRHGVPTPFAFRNVREWVAVFEEAGMEVRTVETYRARWPTLMTYHHSLFVLDRA
jgi:SAM-dependent methyltransferase